MTAKKVVFDIGVVLQAALSDVGPAFACLRLMEAGTIIVPLSPQVREEYEAVLARPAILLKNPFLTAARVQQLLGVLYAKTRLVTVIRPYLQYPRDPNDEKILNLAIQEQADYLVTRDKDLLALRTSSDFRLLYPYMTIVDPMTFVQAMTQEQTSERIQNSRVSEEP